MNEEDDQQQQQQQQLVTEYQIAKDTEEAMRKKKIRDAQWKSKLETRKRDKEELEKEKQAYRDPTENVDAYHKRFRDLQRKVELGLVETTNLATGDEGLARTELKSRLDALNTIVDEMQFELKAATMYLPDYDVQSGTQKIAKCTADIEEARVKLAIRKKFAFGAKKKAAERSKPVVAEKPTETDAGEMRAAEKLLQGLAVNSNEVVFDGNSDMTIDVENKNITDQDVRFANLSNCTVNVLHQTGAIRFLGLKNCRLFIGPVAGSCFFENCHNCIFMIASRQIRIHDSKDCDFYLHVLSRPIIEHCTALRFAPYGLSYPSLATQIEASGLLAERASVMWQDVDDFRWLKQQQSPNWSILPESDRIVTER